MALTPSEFGNTVPVDGYGPGFLRVAGQRHDGPVIVTPTGALPWGGLDDVAALLALAGRIDLVFLGMGADIAHPPAALVQALRDAGLRVEPMATPAAARTYNVLLAEGRQVACALIPA